MKRSEKIVLVLSGAVATALAGCGRDSSGLARLSPNNVYTNNHYVPGAGYYHAPFHGWYPHPHNSYNPDRGYYYGGNWNAYPDDRNILSSKPSQYAANKANAEHKTHTAAARRGGFGSSSRSGVS